MKLKIKVNNKNKFNKNLIPNNNNRLIYNKKITFRLIVLIKWWVNAFQIRVINKLICKSHLLLKIYMIAKHNSI